MSNLNNRTFFVSWVMAVWLTQSPLSPKRNQTVKRTQILRILALILLTLVLGACNGGGNDDTWRVYFTSIVDGDTVDSPVTVRWSAENFTIEPAGDIHEGAGHLHIIVDADCVAAGVTVPADDNHLHFGKAQTEAALELTPGEHTLCLQAADGAHMALAGDGATEVITITVR